MEYPIGIQTFEEIRKKDYYYVDKTEFVWKLTHTNKYYLLIRPRRFGKSLLLSTIEAYYKGRKELFEGLRISELEKDWEQYPVFHFDFNTVGSNSVENLQNSLVRQLSDIEQEWGITSNPKYEPQNRFIELINKVYGQTKKNVVILVDEYDKPLLNVLEEEKLDEEYRKVLKPFYGVLKTMDSKIQFAMLTGVGRFGKLSIFSDLNNLRDISLNPEYNAVCGISEKELYTVFADSIETLAETIGESADETKQLLKKNYDGYHFGKPRLCEDVYNPFSIINCFADRDIRDFWFESGTPSSLIKRLIRRQCSFSGINGQTTDEASLMTGITPGDSSIGYLFQSGYVTIKDYIERRRRFVVGFPNEEVERGFDTLTLKIYAQRKQSDFDIFKFEDDVFDGRPEDFMKRLQAFTADFPNDQIPDMEVHYHNIVYLVFKLLGFQTDTEYKTSDGRIDAVVKTDDFVYVFEFKLDHTPQQAIDQINSKDYPLPFQADGRKLFKIGVSFSSKTKRIQDWLIE